MSLVKPPAFFVKVTILFEQLAKSPSILRGRQNINSRYNMNFSAAFVAGNVRNIRAILELYIFHIVSNLCTLVKYSYNP